MRGSLATVFLLSLLLLDARAVLAQSGRGAHPFDPSLATADVSFAEARAMLRSLRRSQLMLAFGSALLAASASHMAIFGRRFSCYDHDEKIRYVTPPYASGIVAGVSVGLVIGGGVMFAGVPRDFREAQTMRPSRKVALVLGTLGAFAAGSVVMAVPALVERVGCVN